MKTNKTIRIREKKEMVKWLKTLGTSSAFVSLLTETVVIMKQKNKWSGVIKIAKRTGLINVDFLKAVRKHFPNYERGSTWYEKVSYGGKRLALCVHKGDPRRFYVQYFPLASRPNRGTFYVLNGRTLTPEQVHDMYQYVRERNLKEWKPEVVVFAIDSIRLMKARRITVTNNTVDRIMNQLNGIPYERAQEPI